MRRACLLTALLALALVTLTGCNTMQGFGQDIEKVGSEIEEAANR
ncbi:MAG: entericidin A/B family lipoprotein [Halomonas sp.]|nr:entericidin A/B family lipoprotein [Halomonas sp.]